MGKLFSNLVDRWHSDEFDELYSDTYELIEELDTVRAERDLARQQHQAVLAGMDAMSDTNAQLLRNLRACQDKVNRLNTLSTMDHVYSLED